MYSITFGGRREGSAPLFSALSDGQVSAPYYTPANTSSLQPRYTLNDLSIAPNSVYNGTMDTTFTVKISLVDMPPTNCSIKFGPTNPLCTEMNQFQWCHNLAGTAAACTAYSKPMNITAGRAVQLGDTSVYISFSHGKGHYLGDTWQFTAVRTNNPLPVGASITTTMVHSGAPVVNQLTVVPGYVGPSYGLAPLYKVPPVFAVQNQIIASFTLISQNPVALGQGTRNNYMITVNSAYSGRTDSSTACLAWNATAAQVIHTTLHYTPSTPTTHLSALNLSHTCNIIPRSHCRRWSPRCPPTAPTSVSPPTAASLSPASPAVLPRATPRASPTRSTWRAAGTTGGLPTRPPTCCSSAPAHPPDTPTWPCSPGPWTP